MLNKFFVEGRRFPDAIQAFTFASIQADRMDRPVEVQLDLYDKPWHCTAHPESYKRSHVTTVKTAP